MSRCTLAVASEGSFGPHPGLFFIAADEEWIMLKYNVHQLELVVREVCTETNYGYTVCHSLDEANEFAERSRFPSHALIVRAGRADFRWMQKGIQDDAAFETAVGECLRQTGQVYIETDMRAQYNPARQEVIKSAAQKLITKAFSFCPSCHYPGFDTVAVREGLPCNWCGAPTRSILYHVIGCTHCGCFQYAYYPRGEKKEDPQFCPYCNP